MAVLLLARQFTHQKTQSDLGVIHAHDVLDGAFLQLVGQGQDIPTEFVELGVCS